MQQGLYRNDGVMLMAPLDDFHYDLINSQILIECYKYYGGQVNIAFGEYSNPHDQYSELAFQSDEDVENWGDADDVDFGNANPGQSARVYVGKTRKDIYNQFSYYSEWQTPITLTEIVTGYARTAAHEVGHLLGLTETNGVLGGIAYLGELSLGGPHNRNPWSALNIMDPGNAHATTNGLLYKIGRAGPWTFRSLNQDYLEFVLPH